MFRPLCRTVPRDLLCEGDKLVMAMAYCDRNARSRGSLAGAQSSVLRSMMRRLGLDCRKGGVQSHMQRRRPRPFGSFGKWNYEGGDWNLILSSCSLRAKVENGILSKEGDPTAQLTQRKHWDALAILGSDRWASALSRTELSFWEFAAIGNGT